MPVNGTDLPYEPPLGHTQKYEALRLGFHLSIDSVRFKNGLVVFTC